MSDAPLRPVPPAPLSPAAVRAGHRERLFPNVANYYAEPLVAERAAGMHLWDAEGRRYLDFFGGILTVAVGHCHPRVVAALAEQAARLGHTSTLYPNARTVALAERLGDKTPIERPDGRPPKVFFTNSGTEADETAVLTARLFTGSGEVHRRCATATAAARRWPWASPATPPGATGGAGPAGHPAHGAAPTATAARSASPIRRATCAARATLEELIRTSTSGRVAALIAEPIQGVGGFITPPQEFFAIAGRTSCASTAASSSATRCRPASGRTGKHWCGIEHWGVTPEIMTFAKGIANGMPMGATVARADVADAFKGLTISTFGGNPLVDAPRRTPPSTSWRRRTLPAAPRRLGARFRGRARGAGREAPAHRRGARHGAHAGARAGQGPQDARSRRRPRPASCETRPTRGPARSARAASTATSSASRRR